MKRILILSALCALFATGCAKQEPGAWKPGTVQFVITAGAGAESRAIYSEEPITPTLPDVKVYAFLSNGTDYLYIRTIPIPDWTNGLSFTIDKSIELTAGDYRFLAVGRFADDGYTLPEPTATSTFEDMLATFAGGAVAADIYAGDAPANITTEGIRVPINMTRKVAGVMGYFTNIPEFVNDTKVGYLRLSISTANTIVNLSTGEGSVSSATPNQTLIEFNFAGQAAVGGVYPGVDIPGVNKLDNSYLNGAFVVPVTAKLVLGLYDEAGTTPLREWRVNGGADIAIEANNLYSLGVKKQAGNTNGGTPEDDDDDDKGTDMSLIQELLITVTPDWDAVNPLDI